MLPADCLRSKTAQAKAQSGTQYDLDATLKKTEEDWLIDGF